MHQTRQETTTKLPISRKGNKYVARAISHVQSSVPVIIAMRDMLKQARTSAEVKALIKAKQLKINGRAVKDFRESIRLFNVFEADKPYMLTILPTKKFSFTEPFTKNARIVNITDKRLVGKGKVQYNFHDGSNLISSTEMKTGDSVVLDFSGKQIKHIPLEKGKEVFVFSGSYTGAKAKVIEVEGKQVKVNVNGKDVQLSKLQVAAI